MTQEEYFVLINYFLIANTLLVAGFSTVCFCWTGIARTPVKKTIFAGCGGALLVFVAIRIFVALLPTNLPLLVLIAVLHTIMTSVMLGIQILITLTVRKRQKEMDADERCRNEACKTPNAERWDVMEEKMLAFGRDAGWL